MWSARRPPSNKTQEMAPILMYGLVAELETPRRTTSPRRVRLSELSDGEYKRSLTAAPEDLPRFAHSTLRRAQVSSQKQTEEWKAEMDLTKPMQPQRAAPPPLPGRGLDPFQPRHPVRGHTERIVPDTSPPIAPKPPPPTHPPFWRARPRSATGQSG